MRDAVGGTHHSGKIKVALLPACLPSDNGEQEPRIQLASNRYSGRLCDQCFFPVAAEQFALMQVCVIESC